MRVILLRHGPAGSQDPSRWPDDRLRPLTPRGEERTRLACAGLAKLAGDVSVILTSPLVRANQTARIACALLGARHPETLEALTPGGSAREVIAALRRLPAEATVMLVGHEPDLGQFAGMLVSSGSVALPLKKAGAAAILFDEAPAPGTGELQWFTPPRLLRQLAGRKARA